MVDDFCKEFAAQQEKYMIEDATYNHWKALSIILLNRKLQDSDFILESCFQIQQ